MIISIMLFIFVIRPFWAFVFDPSEIVLSYDNIIYELSEEDQQQIIGILRKKPFLMKHFIYFSLSKYGWKVSDKIHLSVSPKIGLKYKLYVYPEFGGVIIRTNPYNAYQLIEDNDAVRFMQIIDNHVRNGAEGNLPEKESDTEQ